MPRGNQHKPLPPEEELQDWVWYYWHLDKNDKEIVELVLDNYDRTEYGLSIDSIKRRRRTLGLQGTRKQGQTKDSVTATVLELRKNHPNMGARMMRAYMLREKGMKVPEKLLLEWFKEHEPEQMKARWGGHRKRQRYWVAGVGHHYALDQHDKWLRFGLFPHIGVDPGSGMIVWLRIWWTNSPPELVCRYYLDSCRIQKSIPLLTMSDPGSENGGVAACQTEARQRLDPTLVGSTIQHLYMRDKANIKPETGWSMFRRQFSPRFEPLFDHGLDNEWFHPHDPLEKLIFRWIAIPWMQAEINAWISMFNMTARRARKGKILPKGEPVLIAANPRKYNLQDFRVAVPPELFDEMEAKYCPTTHPVFELVPPAFDEQISHCYRVQLGSPVVNVDTFWQVFGAVLVYFRSGGPLAPAVHEALESARVERYPPVTKASRREALQEEAAAMGGVPTEGTGMEEWEPEFLAVFTDEDEESSDDE